MRPEKINAIMELVQGCRCTVDINGLVDWQSEDLEQPSEEAIQTKLTELQAKYEANQYQRDRAEQYPSIQDVVVALAEKQEGDDTMWQEITALRQKVKSDNPKPE